MEEDWERRHDLVTLDLPTIAALLQPVFPGCRLVAARLITQGKCNTNYQVQVEGHAEPVLLRLYVRDTTACAREYRLWQLVRNRVPVPEILYSTNGTPTVSGQQYSVLTWIEGISLAEWLPNAPEVEVAQVAYELGTILTAIGTHQFAQAGFFDSDLKTTYAFDNVGNAYLAHLEDCLTRPNAPAHLGATLTDAIRRFVAKNHSCLDAIRGESKLVHADYKASNLLIYTGVRSGRVAAVLDWEFAHAGSPLTDIGNLLRHGATMPHCFGREFVHGFAESGGDLPEDWRRISKLLDLVSLCDLIDSPSVRPTLLRDIRRLARATIDIDY